MADCDQWCHCENAGTCIGCLIVATVSRDYGTQGLQYLLEHLERHVGDDERLVKQRAEIRKAAGLIACLLSHTLHSGSLDLKKGQYNRNRNPTTYALYSRRKEAAVKWLARNRA